jgi:hypothetical protein
LSKLLDGAVGELAQHDDLTDRVSPIQGVGDGFPDPLAKTALAYGIAPVAVELGKEALPTLSR